MNTYRKFCPNVFVAKCEEEYNQGDEITVTTKRGKENKHIVYNFLHERDGYFYYSIVRSDGFNHQEWARRKANKLNDSAAKSIEKSNEYYKASQEGKDFLSLGEPIKIGHHSEKRHRALIERNWKRMGKSIEHQDKAEEKVRRAEYWEQRAEEINLSMPESLEYFEYELEKAEALHKGLKDGTIERSHSYSLAYAKKDVNKYKKQLDLAKRLWA